MSKVLLISTGQAPDWESWSKLKGRKKPGKTPLTMTQSEALVILEKVVTAITPEEAAQFLMTTVPSRREFSHWLGQVGYRQTVRLGRGKGLRAYVTAVMESIRNRQRDREGLSERKEESEMGKKADKPVVVIRKGGKRRHEVNESVESPEMIHVRVDEGSSNATGNQAMDLTFNDPEKVQKSDMDMRPADTTSEQPPTMSKVQEYSLKSILTYADCSVQKDENGIFAVLGRNFADKPILNFWLWKVGYGHLSKFGRNKDLVDFLRILSRDIYRDMKQNIGRPISRW